MNGDSHCYNHQHTAGALIRNGTVYRAEPTSADVCVLFQSGEMKTYSPDQFDLQQVMQEGAYQSWTFGPSLPRERRCPPSIPGIISARSIPAAPLATMNLGITASLWWTAGRPDTPGE